MNTINFEILCGSIKKVIPKAPITYLSESSIVFRGQRLDVNQNTARCSIFDLYFTSPETFLDGLKAYGLMISYREMEQVMKEYRIGKTYSHEER